MQPDELEEGEIAVSGDSHMDLQQSGSWIHDRDDGEDEQVLQPKIKRKRSIRLRPRHNLERFEDKSSGEKHFTPRGNSAHVPSHVGHLHEAQLRNESEIGTTLNDAVTTDRHQRHILPSRRATSSAKSNVLQKPNRSNCLPGLAENASEHYRESWDGKTMNLDGPVMFGQKMSEIVQRRVCIWTQCCSCLFFRVTNFGVRSFVLFTEELFISFMARLFFKQVVRCDTQFKGGFVVFYQHCYWWRSLD